MNVRRIVMMAIVVAVVAAACSADPPDALEPDIDRNPVDTVAPNEDVIAESRAEPCGEELPVIFAADDPSVTGGIDGTPGPGRDSREVAAGELVATWQTEFDVTIEARWPGRPIPSGAATMSVPNTAYSMSLWPTNPAGDGERVSVTVQVGDDPNDPCSLLTVEAFAPRVDPILDYLFGFATGLRPRTERAELVNDRANAITRADPDDAPSGRCSVSRPTTLDDNGDVDIETRRSLLEDFLADRLAGNAAGSCLANPALDSYRTSEPLGDLPGLCLSRCADIELVGGRVQETPSGRVNLLVDYRRFDGEMIHLREWLEVGTDRSGDALILSAGIGPDSYVDEARARRTISDFLDATAAHEYGIAGRYLFNEGTPHEVAERIGEFGVVDDFDGRFAEFCRTAACDAPYVVGAALDPLEFQRTFSVEFETTAGPVIIPIAVGSFEGILTVQNLPPEGTGTGLAPIDERIFGRPYDGDLTIVRQRVVQRLRDGHSSWIGDYRLRGFDRVDVAGDFVITRAFGREAGAVRVFEPNDGEQMADVVILRAVGATETYPAGGSNVAGRAIAFLAGDDKIFAVVDLDTGEQAAVFPADKAWGDAAPEEADATDGRIVVTVVVGDSSWLEVYEFDAATLTAGALVTQVRPEGVLGYGSISPDGRSVVATLFADSSVPVTTVAVFDATTGDLRDRFALEGGEQVVEIDYDGRWIVARLDNEQLWVIDAATGTTRRVDSPVQVRFG
jgi:hypothetical protein